MNGEMGEVLVSIHAPRAGSDPGSKTHSRPVRRFNPRSPRGERRRRPVRSAPPRRCFNPRSPRGERPWRFWRRPGRCWVSIHAPRAGSDALGARFHSTPRSFNPRSPRGERPAEIDDKTGDQKFQSTLPARGATGRHGPDLVGLGVSIHAPRAGSDPTNSHGPVGRQTFQSTLPARGATGVAASAVTIRTVFQSTLPARGATRRQPGATS